MIVDLHSTIRSIIPWANRWETTKKFYWLTKQIC